MSLEPLVAAIDALEPASFEGEVLRHVASGRDPRSGRGARIHGGRWNPPDSFAVVYCGLDVEIVVADAEFHRLARRQGVPVAGFLPRELYRLRVRLEAVLDLREADAQSTLHLTSRELGADGLTTTQRVGAAAHAVGLEGVLAPSAANGGTVLAIFLDALRPDSMLEVVGIEAVWHEPPEPHPRASQ